MSSELEPNAASYFQNIIVIFTWMIELERTYIITEVSLFSSHLALPRGRHIDTAMHVMAYFGQ